MPESPVSGRGQGRSRRRRGRAAPALSPAEHRATPNFTVASPAELLRHAHISELPTIGEHAKVLQTVTEGDWPWRSGRWVAVPAAELCDDPSGPGQAVHGMRVLLERRPTLDLGVEAFEARRCRSG